MSRRSSQANSVVAPTAGIKWLSGMVIVIYALVTMLPLVWIFMTSFKSQRDAISYPPKFIPVVAGDGETAARPTTQSGEQDFTHDPTFNASIVGFCHLFTTRTRQTAEYMANLPPPAEMDLFRPNPATGNPPSWWLTTFKDFFVTCEQQAREDEMTIAGLSGFGQRFMNSFIIGFGSTFLTIILGTMAAYGFSRFKVPLADDLLFFILSTRMMPPIAVAIPIFLMYRTLGLSDTHLGMILLYTAVNISLAVWLLKGFMDEIPREYEEAAMIDGYTRFQAFRKVVLPQAGTGIAATAIFCLIFAWNEYAFALLLTSGTAQTAPPFIPTIIGEGGLDWPAVAAGATLFLVPVLVFTVLLRRHLLRGITFGAVRK